jgi:hypothetical protein
VLLHKHVTVSLRGAAMMAPVAILALGSGTSAPDPWTPEPAVWQVAPAQQLRPSTSSVDVLVSRLACNNGVTGTVLPPIVRASHARVVITFSVAPSDQSGDYVTCIGNKQVRYTVDLHGDLSGREVVDGQCLHAGPAQGTAFCDEGSTRLAGRAT